MAFLKSGLAQDPVPVLRGRTVWLRPPAMHDYSHWAQLRALSREHLVPWEPQWTRDELSRSAYRRRLRHYQREMRDDQGYAFFIFRSADDVLIGGVTLSNVRRGVSQAAALGYWIGATHVRRGYMTEAVGVSLCYAFEDLHLHRLEAACLPANRGSIRVLELNGFEREGLARRYLKINGIWQDHVLFGKVFEERQPTGAR